MKHLIWGLVAFFALIIMGVTANSWINRDKEHVYTAEEIFSNECSDRGGNPVTRVGWDNGIHVQEYKCEEAN
jgi:hypothetical protein